MEQNAGKQKEKETTEQKKKTKPTDKKNVIPHPTALSWKGSKVFTLAALCSRSHESAGETQHQYRNRKSNIKPDGPVRSLGENDEQNNGQTVKIGSSAPFLCHSSPVPDEEFFPTRNVVRHGNWRSTKDDEK